MKIQDLTETQVKRRSNFIRYLEDAGWKKTKAHEDFVYGEDYYIDAQLSKKLNNTSISSLIQEYSQILFEAEFDDFILRLSTEDCRISHSAKVIEELPLLSDIDEVEKFLVDLLNSGVNYTIGVGDDFEILSNKTIQEFVGLVS